MIRVLIERQLKEDVDERLQQAMRHIRREAIHCSGYVSGETLRYAADPRHYVIISTWRSREDWDQWIRSDARKQIEEKLRPLLVEPEKYIVLEPA